MSKPKSCTRELRRHPRFPCVGIELLYSPINRQSLPDVASMLLHATSHDISMAGMAFDIGQTLPIGQHLLVTVKTPEGETETLKTEVRWCTPLPDQLYRVGVAIIAVEQWTPHSTSGYEVETIGQEHGAPSRASFVCPACKKRSWFVLVGQQEGPPKPAIMPLYNCSECQTTRSITSLLGFNRSLVTGE